MYPLTQFPLILYDHGIFVKIKKPALVHYY